LLFAALGFAGLAALATGLILVLGAGIFAAVFATGIDKNLKQRAYNHNSHKEEGRENGNHQG
jgi:hypothetical protein